MSTVPTKEPSTIRAGDFLTWSKDLSPDYRADQGWALAYTLINATTKLTINASADGAKFLVSVPAATSAGYAAGGYDWMARVSKGTEIYTVGSGRIQIEPNWAALSAYDGRSHARKMLEAIESAYEGRASNTQLEMEINGRRIQYMGAEELIKWHSHYKALVVQEDQAERFARTGINPRRVGVRLRRV